MPRWVENLINEMAVHWKLKLLAFALSLFLWFYLRRHYGL